MVVNFQTFIGIKHLPLEAGFGKIIYGLHSAPLVHNKKDFFVKTFEQSSLILISVCLITPQRKERGNWGGGGEVPYICLYLLC